MRNVLIASMAGAILRAYEEGAAARAEHEGEELDLSPRRIMAADAGLVAFENETHIEIGKDEVVVRPPRPVLKVRKDKSQALARLLKSKGRK